jgi:hypothetical protein
MTQNDVKIADSDTVRPTNEPDPAMVAETLTAFAGD